MLGQETPGTINFHKLFCLLFMMWCSVQNHLKRAHSLLQAVRCMSEVQAPVSSISNLFPGELEVSELAIWNSFTRGATRKSHLKGTLPVSSEGVEMWHTKKFNCGSATQRVKPKGI